MTTLVRFNGEHLGSYGGIPSADTIRQAAAITEAPIPVAAKKTALRRLYESALAQDARMFGEHKQSIVQSAFSAAVGGAEGAGIGYLLGRLAGGSHGKYAGIAAAGVAVGGLAASVIPGNPFAGLCRDAGIAGAAVAAYRKGEAAEGGPSGGGGMSTPAAHGSGDDPTDRIVQIAKKLGIE